MSARVQNHITGRLSLRPPPAESISKLATSVIHLFKCHEG